MSKVLKLPRMVNGSFFDRKLTLLDWLSQMSNLAPELGYGSSGAPPKIPGNSVLVFEVELTAIDRKDEL